MSREALSFLRRRLSQGRWNVKYKLLVLGGKKDREHWKDLSHNFLCWMDQRPPSTKLEMLPNSPWESKGSLLRQQANCLLTLVLTVHHDAEGRLVQLAWLDTVHGFSIITQKDLHPAVADAVSWLLKLQSLCLMQYKPFVLQLAVCQTTIWDHLIADPAKYHHLLRDGQIPWYQVFSSPADARTTVLQPYLDLASPCLRQQNSLLYVRANPSDAPAKEIGKDRLPTIIFRGCAMLNFGRV